jgi:hypothetical protein
LINIGSDAVAAIRKLRDVPAFNELIEALNVIAQNKVFEARKAPPDMRVHATSYADGMYDLWASVHAAHAELLPSQVKPKIRQGANAYAQ